jgi:hypothetical protein
MILARKRSFYEKALSIITTVLPSEKQAKTREKLEEVLKVFLPGVVSGRRQRFCGTESAPHD